MLSMVNYYATKRSALLRGSQVHSVANPLINITLQGRHDTSPKRRGMTRVKELLLQGINVAFGHDCLMDPWYPMGSHDMLEVARLGLHVGQMTGVEAQKACFAAVPEDGARVMHLRDYGLNAGCHAALALLQARDGLAARRQKPDRNSPVSGKRAAVRV